MWANPAKGNNPYEQHLDMTPAKRLIVKSYATT
jgi:hypothetical protein